MSLVKCRECGKDVSTEADKCPNCGYPMKRVEQVESIEPTEAVKPRKKIGCFSTFAIIIGVLIFIGGIGNHLDKCSDKRQQKKDSKQAEEEYKKKAQLAEKEYKKKAQLAEKEMEKKEKQRETFIEKIEDNYQKVVELYNAEKYEEAMNEIKTFSSYDRADYNDIKEYHNKLINIGYQKALELYKTKKYAETIAEINKYISIDKIEDKDIKQLYNKAKIGELEQRVKKIPASEYWENYVGYLELMKLDPNNQLYKKKADFYQKKHERKQREEERKQRKERLMAGSDLELISWRWSDEHGYAIAEGQVKNISGERLKNVEALVTWFDKNGKLVTSDSSIIEYNPIMPGQTSPFKVLEPYNPAMKKARVEFKFLFGGEIPTYQK